MGSRVIEVSFCLLLENARLWSWSTRVFAETDGRASGAARPTAPDWTRLMANAVGSTARANRRCLNTLPSKRLLMRSGADGHCKDPGKLRQDLDGHRGCSPIPRNLTFFPACCK